MQVEVRHTSSCSSYFCPHLVGAPSGAVASSRVWHSISPCGPSGRRHHHTLVDRNSAISTATPQHTGEVETRRRSPLLQGNARSLSPLQDRGCSIDGCDSSIICEPQRVRSRRLGRYPAMVSQHRKPRCLYSDVGSFKEASVPRYSHSPLAPAPSTPTASRLHSSNAQIPNDIFQEVPNYPLIVIRGHAGDGWETLTQKTQRKSWYVAAFLKKFVT